MTIGAGEATQDDGGSVDADPTGDKGRNSATPERNSTAQAGWRLAIEFAVDGDVRFVAHRDMMRVFARAALRARLPLRFSQGFNPHPRISIPFPRPVGIGSDGERLVMELTAAIEPSTALAQLAQQMPRGITLKRAWKLQPHEKCLPVRVHYRADVPLPQWGLLSQHAANLLGASPILVRRHNPKKGRDRDADVRPFLENVRVDADGVEMTLRVSQAGTARPADILQALGLPAEVAHHRLRRLEVEWQ